MEFESAKGELRIAFSARYLKELKRLEKKEPLLHQLVLDVILRNPNAGNVIPGSGGWRKVRLASPSQGRGKSGGFRFIHLHLGTYSVLYLMDIYSKSEQAD